MRVSWKGFIDKAFVERFCGVVLWMGVSWKGFANKGFIEWFYRRFYRLMHRVRIRVSKGLLHENQAGFRIPREGFQFHGAKKSHAAWRGCRSTHHSAWLWWWLHSQHFTNFCFFAHLALFRRRCEVPR
jgi:hypothetical protein